MKPCRYKVLIILVILVAGLPDQVALGEGAGNKHAFPAAGARTKRESGGIAGASGWWFGTAGIALALVAVGAVSLGARKLGLAPKPSSLKVIDRVSLSPKHAVFCVQAKDRLLILGTGPQGPPSFLGELDLDDEPRTDQNRSSRDIQKNQPQFDSSETGTPKTRVTIAPRIDRTVGGQI